MPGTGVHAFDVIVVGLPAASVPRTCNVCVALYAAVTVWPLAHGANVPPSSAHATLAESPTLNVKSK
jgi:hypothetical protein